MCRTAQLGQVEGGAQVDVVPSVTQGVTEELVGGTSVVLGR